MHGFMDKARDLALAEDNVTDANTSEWAARAFACIAMLGNQSVIEGNNEQSLATLLAKAPDDVLVGGTIVLAHVVLNNPPEASV